MKTEKIITITDDNYHYSSGYFVTNKWIDNSSFVAVRSKDMSLKAPNELVKISLCDGKIEVLDKNISYTLFATAIQNKIYYNNCDGIIEMDLQTKSKRLVCQTDAGCLQFTNDGKYASVFKVKENGVSDFYRVEFSTGKCEKICSKMFRKPFNVANHLMISPTNKDMFFFAHEGDTFYVSNRLWLYDSNSKKAWNIAKQRLDENGTLGDCFGHEMWAPDGKGLYFVKYPCSPVGPRGICYADIQGTDHKLLYSKYDYWHVGVSADGSFLTADTKYDHFQSQVVVIDTQKGIELEVDRPYMTGSHPCHPHPQLSPDNKKLCYTALDKPKGKMCVKIAYLND